MTPDLHAYRWVVVNSSGGKDSQTALRHTVLTAIRQSYPLNRIVVSHQDLGRMEWKGTKELARQQADHYGLRFVTSKYRNKAGAFLTLLDYVRKRGMWPDSKNRFCTSEFKRGPGARIITQLYREDKGDILNVLGFRSQESLSRAQRKTFTKNTRSSTKSRLVHDWLPIHHFTEEEVWNDIRQSGVPHHPAYDLGMPRLSCVFCIFASRDALLLAGKHNPELLDQYCEVEHETGHNFRANLALTDIREQLQSGTQAPEKIETWVM